MGKTRREGLLGASSPDGNSRSAAAGTDALEAVRQRLSQTVVAGLLKNLAQPQQTGEKRAWGSQSPPEAHALSDQDHTEERPAKRKKADAGTEAWLHVAWGGYEASPLHLVPDGEGYLVLALELRQKCPNIAKKMKGVKAPGASGEATLANAQQLERFKKLGLLSITAGRGKLLSLATARQLLGSDYPSALAALKSPPSTSPCDCPLGDFSASNKKTKGSSGSVGFKKIRPGAVTDEGDYMVEEILDDRQGEEGEREYLIKWVGWGPKHNTWEPEENLSCDELLAQFHLKYLERHEKKYELCIPMGPEPGQADSILHNAQRFLKAQTEGFEDPPEPEIHIRNEVDSQGLMVVQYLQMCTGRGEASHDGDPMVFCDCGNCGESSTCCRHTLWEQDDPAPYDSNKRVIVPKGTPLIECNKNCKCGPECPFRVVQLGRKVKLDLVRTRHKGWGVCAREHIPKGTFVVEYTGELIKDKEVDRKIRTNRYPEDCRTYFFDLDAGHSTSDMKNEYTIDAYPRGNISRWINHSCDPNLDIYTVWVNQQKETLGRIALFANRDLAAGEELSFNYRGNHYDEDQPRRKKSSKVKTLPCHCATAKCRGYMLEYTG